MRKILVVDDDPQIAAALVAFLQLSCSAAGVDSVDAAFARLARERFDVVLAEVDLERSERGLWLLAEVARRWPSVRRVAMSARVHAARGPFLKKPFDLDELCAVTGARGAWPGAHPARAT